MDVPFIGAVLPLPPFNFRELSLMVLRYHTKGFSTYDAVSTLVKAAGFGLVSAYVGRTQRRVKILCVSYDQRTSMFSL